MLNWIWLAMILIAVIAGGFGGKLGPMTEGAFDTAKSAVMDIALPLIGLMAIWLGIMRLAEKAGLVRVLARALRPLMRRLFPDIPAEHPAMGAMVLNMSANILGLGNAATPLGLRAMALLQKLNPSPAVASNAMVTFLTINTASIQLIPTTAISILAINGAKNASAIVAPAFLASFTAMICGVVAARFLSRWKAFQISPAEEKEVLPEKETGIEETEAEKVEPLPLTWRKKFFLGAFLGTFAVMFAILAWPEQANALLAKLRGVFSMEATWQYGNFWPDVSPGQRILRAGSLLAIPFLLAFFPLYAALRGVKVYEQFCDGAKEAFDTAKRIIPFIVAMLVAIRLLREAGVVGLMTDALGPMLAKIGFPAELLPLSILRSLSGSASQGVFIDIVKTYGADSLIAQMASTIYGSTETTFYVLAVYFGSVGIRKMRHAVIAGMIADIVAVAGSIVFCRWLNQ